MKKILVTGGAGFIGSNLCKRLVEEGHFVICLDNLFTGRKENIKPLENCENFRFVLHDVTEPYDFEVDEIYNLACPASPPAYQKDPVKTLNTSIFGIIHALELAKKYNAKLLQTSTSEVYGNPLVHPQQESYFGNVNPVGLRSCYDEGKRCAETYIHDYREKYGIDTKIVRIFNTYGVNMDEFDGRVVSNFIVQALENKDITIYGDGSQTRSFCYVDDLVEGLIRMMNNDKNFHGPVNLGNPAEYTVSELAEKIIGMTKSTSKTVFMPLPSDDPVKRRPDITLAGKMLGWKPEISPDEGLLKTIRYFANLKNIEFKS